MTTEPRDLRFRQTNAHDVYCYGDFGHKAYMLNEEQKKRIKLYSAAERNRVKAGRRGVDSAEAARGHAEIVQERNRALPHASHFIFPDQEAEAQRKSPTEIKPVLQALAKTDGVVIGGQAVNLWAEHYQTNSPPWKELQPYTSFDLDVLGSRSDVLKCSEALDAEPFFPQPSENTANSGKIVTRMAGADFEIDFLHSPNGLSPAEVRELAPSITFENIPLKVLHPLHCIESKTVNLATIPQNSGERQDLKHLRLSIAILREYLKELTVTGKSDQILLRWARRVRMNSNHELGLQATIRYGISFQETIPSDVWHDRSGPLGDFMTKEWQEWTDEIVEKTADSRELDQWIASLKNKDS
jgi:hypothetical protein